MLEIALTGPATGNPFVDVDLSAEFVCGDRSWMVGGFYDGDGIYRLRVLAEDGGIVALRHLVDRAVARRRPRRRRRRARAAGAHGPVRVDGFHFAYADGTRYRPSAPPRTPGPTRTSGCRQRTLATLAGSPFNKLRMCLFPKSYLYNHDEPELFPFPRRRRRIVRPRALRPRVLPRSSRSRSRAGATSASRRT